MKKTYIRLFITHLITRVIFSFAMGIHNNYALQPDSTWLVGFGDLAMKGDFNFELERFIVSPLFPIVCGLFKYIFGTLWTNALLLFQLTLSALSGVYIYKIAIVLFKEKGIALVASLLFAVFPLTLWFVSTFSQECLFQVLLIFTIYHLLKASVFSDIQSLFYSSVLFSLCYLTKSHLLLFSIFIPFLFIHHFGWTKKMLFFTGVFASISLLFSLPYGLYQLKKNNSYVISSNGSGYQFYLGNTEAGYKSVVNIPEKGTEDYFKMKNINITAGYFNGSQNLYDSTLKLPQKEKQTAFIYQAFNWIKKNPFKFLELKIYDAIFFVLPGVSFRHYPLKEYLFSLTISLFIYLFAYISLFNKLKEDFKHNSFMLYLCISMLLFSVIWYTQNRFRTITLEPFYIVYAAPICFLILDKYVFLRNILKRIFQFYNIHDNDYN